MFVNPQQPKLYSSFLVWQLDKKKTGQKNLIRCGDSVSTPYYNNQCTILIEISIPQIQCMHIYKQSHLYI